MNKHPCVKVLCILWLTAVGMCGLPTITAKAQPSKAEQLKAELATAKTAKDSTRLYLRIGYWHSTDSELDSALRYYRMAHSQSAKEKDTLALATALYFIADYHSTRDNGDSVVYYARKSLATYDAAGIKRIYYTYALNLIAAQYMYAGNYSEAIKYAQQQLDAAVEIRDTVAISNAHTLYGAIYQALGNQEQAIYYVERALALNKASNTTYNRAVVTNNLATLYMTSAQPEKALPLLHESLYIAQNVYKTATDQGTSYMNLAECHKQLGNYDSAFSYFRQAETTVEAYGEPALMQRLYMIGSTIHKKLKHFDSAVVYIDKCISLCQKHQLAKELSAGLLEKADLLTHMNNYREAYNAHYHYAKMKDSIAGEAVRKEIAALEARYESEKKDAHIAQQEQMNEILRTESMLKDAKLRNEILLKQTLESEHLLAQQRIVQDSILNSALDRENALKQEQLVQANLLNASLATENELRKADLRNTRKINALLVGGLGIVLLLGGLLLVQNRKQKAANNTIREQSDKLTLLMKELHHRVKNNLQIISSLLSLQSFRIKDSTAAMAVKEGQQRIEAMSLIHQRLYTRDNITEINIREFVTDLVDSLQSAYGFSNDAMQLRLDIDDELMNVDQAIPLSLIINELVSNAFKYAYKGHDNPELTIQLKKDRHGTHLVVADNGIGVNIEEWKDKEGSFGKELIQTFVKQLNGYLSLVVDNGTQFKLSIP